MTGLLLRAVREDAISPRDKEKKKITLRLTPLGSCEDTEESTSDEDGLQTGLTRDFMRP